jgi:hypothetical protein
VVPPVTTCAVRWASDRGGDVVVPKRDYLSTGQQGRYIYPMSVEETGGHWEWEVNRVPNAWHEIVDIPVVTTGKARTREAAIAAAEAARRNVMDQNRRLDARTSRRAKVSR